MPSHCHCHSQPPQNPGEAQVGHIHGIRLIGVPPCGIKPLTFAMRDECTHYFTTHAPAQDEQEQSVISLAEISRIKTTNSQAKSHVSETYGE